MTAMRIAGRKPNCTVVFGPDPTAADTAPVRGFLIEDRRSNHTCRRYLVLEDGDVLCAPRGGWLPEPDDDVVTLLARALSDARMGGSGWLAEGDGTVELAPDRRSNRSHTKVQRGAAKADVSAGWSRLRSGRGQRRRGSTQLSGLRVQVQVYAPGSTAAVMARSSSARIASTPTALRWSLQSRPECGTSRCFLALATARVRRMSAAFASAASSCQSRLISTSRPASPRGSHSGSAIRRSFQGGIAARCHREGAERAFGHGHRLGVQCIGQRLEETPSTFVPAL